MKDYKEMAESVLSRRNTYLQAKQKRKLVAIRIGVPAICMALVVALGISTYGFRFSKGFSDDSHTSSKANQVLNDSYLSVPSQNTSLQSPSSLPSSQIDSTAPSRPQSTQNASSSTNYATNSESNTLNSIVTEPSIMPSSLLPPGDKEKNTIIVSGIKNLVRYLSQYSALPGKKPTISRPSSTLPSSSPSESYPPGALWPEASSQNPQAPAYSDYYAAEAAPSVSSLPELSSDDISILARVWTLFETGSFMMPKGLDELLVLAEISVDRKGVQYHYQWNNTYTSEKNTGCYINMYINNKEATTTINSYTGGRLQNQIINRAIRYTTVKHESFYFVHWNYDSKTYTARIYGTEEQLLWVLQNLSLEEYDWYQ